MGLQRLKLAKGLGSFVPVSINFSELEKELDEDSVEFEPGDDCKQMNDMMDKLVYEEAVVTILSNLETREKLVFMFQLLRDGGYQIDHASSAKIVKLSRRQYMRVLDDVRMKSWLYIQGYKVNNRHPQSHKEG